MTSPSTPTGTWVRWLPTATWVAVGGCGWLAFAAGDTGIRWATGVVLVASWAAVLVATLVPSTAALTVVRWTAGLAPVAAAAALVAADARAVVVPVAVAALVHVVVVARAEVGQAYVQTSAYGDETRLPLRPPATFRVPLAALWTVWAAIVVAAVITLSTMWGLGIVLVVIGTAATLVVLPRVHRLSMRWLVVVPAGLVVHDPVVLGETLMVGRGNVAGVALALQGTEAADLSGPASGHALEVVVREMVTVLLPVTRDHPGGRAIHVQSFLVAPSRPGRALHELGSRRLPVG